MMKQQIRFVIILCVLTATEARNVAVQQQNRFQPTSNINQNDRSKIDKNIKSGNVKQLINKFSNGNEKKSKNSLMKSNTHNTMQRNQQTNNNIKLINLQPTSQKLSSRMIPKLLGKQEGHMTVQQYKTRLMSLLQDKSKKSPKRTKQQRNIKGLTLKGVPMVECSKHYDHLFKKYVNPQNKNISTTDYEWLVTHGMNRSQWNVCQPNQEVILQTNWRNQNKNAFKTVGSQQFFKQLKLHSQVTSVLSRALMAKYIQKDQFKRLLKQVEKNGLFGLSSKDNRKIIELQRRYYSQKKNGNEIQYLAKLYKLLLKNMNDDRNRMSNKELALFLCTRQALQNHHLKPFKQEIDQLFKSIQTVALYSKQANQFFDWLLKEMRRLPQDLRLTIQITLLEYRMKQVQNQYSTKQRLMKKLQQEKNALTLARSQLKGVKQFQCKDYQMQNLDAEDKQNQLLKSIYYYEDRLLNAV